MPNQDIARQAKSVDDALGVRSEVGKGIAIRRRIGLAPAAMIDRDCPMRVRKFRGDVAPGTGRPSPVVQENDRQFARSVLIDVDANVV
jgi:hypothetical protein